MMNKVEINLTNIFSKIFCDNMIENSCEKINLAYIHKESCPSIFVKNILNCSVFYPKKLIIKIRNFCDQIKHKVINMICSLIEQS